MRNTKKCNSPKGQKKIAGDVCEFFLRKHNSDLFKLSNSDSDYCHIRRTDAMNVCEYEQLFEEREIIEC